jgi:CheY-like chemotaxis protein
MSSQSPFRPQNKAATDQFAALSHEFRTPLNGVLGMTRLLEGTRLTAEQRSYVNALKESGEHLLGLVNDVLDFAKLGESGVELHPAPVDVETLLRSVCELMSPRAREKGIEVAWAAPAGVGRILADEGRLRQILLNLAANAVKFTDEGGVLLSVTRRGARLRFKVEDTGPGVPRAQRHRIFEAFAQADPAHAQLGGVGLGLAIARRLALAMHGAIGVGRARAGGAVFWMEAGFSEAEPCEPDRRLAGLTIGVASPNAIIREAAQRQIAACGGRAVMADDIDALAAETTDGDILLLDHALVTDRRLMRPPRGRRAIVLLAPEERARITPYRSAGFSGYLIKPLRRASLAERVLAAGAAQPATTQHVEDDRIAQATAPGSRVLLVEDNPINAMLARTLLSREGCAVDHARGGEEAIAAVKVGRYDLILMDMRMPGMSGVEATAKLRGAGVATPIVALTANAFEDDRHACLAAGMNDFLVKPLAPDALRAALSTWAKGDGWTEPATRGKVG